MDFYLSAESKLPFISQPGYFQKNDKPAPNHTFASLIPDMYFHACARSKIQITAPPDQLSFFAATNEKGRSHFPYIWISQIFSQIIFSLFAPPINSMTTLYHKGERINANFTGALSLTSSNLSDGLLIFSAPLGEQQEVPSLLMLTISSHITSQSNRPLFSAAPLGEQ